MLIESLVLAVAGALAGLVLALGGLALVHALGLDLSSQGFEFQLDTTVLMFTLGAAVLAALVAGLPPVLVLLSEDLIRVVQEGRTAWHRRTRCARIAKLVGRRAGRGGRCAARGRGLARERLLSAPE